jgi:hypothetical protein
MVIQVYNFGNFSWTNQLYCPNGLVHCTVESFQKRKRKRKDEMTWKLWPLLTSWELQGH